MMQFAWRQGYEATKKIADVTTIYCHSNDEALMSAEILSKGRKCMGRHPFGYIRSLPKLDANKDRDTGSPSHRLSTSDTRVSTDSRHGASPAHQTRSSGASGASSPKAVDSEDSGAASPMDRFGMGKSGGRWRDGNANAEFKYSESKTGNAVAESKQDEPDVHDEQYEWLDVDVIDCTYLEANVHQLRHCFFNINASVVGDLRELLTQKTRASQRHHQLELRDGNVYTFRVPPARLSSIFGV
eukprot:Gregarina_sp_Poly_1__10034@NODE_672_length_6835_cov_143_220597_g507_i0_p4_GENE_NODE_672_length_6835_cov_143_220597_g507_i0NODE_672_length_6835_cov_143_220597_g507_i0_p4_ORF_typecomplete_len242_score34_31_NODE_672_length_6835_cov_143_220597_g507_i057046429